jgi:hypothetical protein
VVFPEKQSLYLHLIACTDDDHGAMLRGFQRREDGQMGLAEAEGKLKIGDRVVRLNGEDVESMAFHILVSKLRGCTWPLTAQFGRAPAPKATKAGKKCEATKGPKAANAPKAPCEKAKKKKKKRGNRGLALVAFNKKRQKEGEDERSAATKRALTGDGSSSTTCKPVGRPKGIKEATPRKRRDDNGDIADWISATSDPASKKRRADDTQTFIPTDFRKRARGNSIHKKSAAASLDTPALITR